MPKAEARWDLTARDKTGRAFRSVQRRFGEVAKTAAKLGAGISIGVGVAFARAASGAVRTAAEIGRLAEELGLSTEFLSEIRGLLPRVGGDFEQLVGVFRTLAERVTEFAEGGGTATDAFTRIGIALDDLQGKTPEQQFDILLEALRQTEDVTKRNATAFELFGDEASTVLRLADLTKRELRRLRDEQRALGSSLSQDTTDAAIDFGNALQDVKDAANGLVLRTVVENIDDVVEAFEAVIDLIPDVAKAITAFINFGSKVGAVFRGVGTFIGGAGAAIGAAREGNFSGARSILDTLLGDAFGISPREFLGSQFLERTRGAPGTGSVTTSSGDVIKFGEEQAETNDILRQIAREGLVGVAG